MMSFSPAVLFVAVIASQTGVDEKPIPQNSERQQQRFRDMLEWNRRTLVGAYDAAGKKDPRWDKPAREALELAARNFSHALEPEVTDGEVYAAAKRAVDAGCDDGLILYLYARTARKANDPGPQESARRHVTAADALGRSAYPPFRRAVAYARAGGVLSGRKDATPDTRREAERLFDAALALLPESADKDERCTDLENRWSEWPNELIEGYRELGADYPTAFARVDAVLAKVPALKATRLRTQGYYLVHYAWQARGSGVADTVTDDGWQKFRERLTAARQALEDSWAAQPGVFQTANLMFDVETGIGGDRASMEKWFTRAMEADGNNQPACSAKLNWLDPKWHGSVEEMLAFGRECRDTKNWRTGITLLLADAHVRASRYVPQEPNTRYMMAKDVVDDIRGV
jgi:hypothetical protein